MKNCLIHFDYGEIEFAVSKKDLNKVEVKKKIFINIFYQCLSCLHIKSKIWKFNGFVDNIT